MEPPKKVQSFVDISTEIIIMVCKTATDLSYRFPDDSYGRICVVEKIDTLTGEKISKELISDRLPDSVDSRNALFWCSFCMVSSIF